MSVMVKISGFTKGQVENSVKTFALSKRYTKTLIKTGSLNIIYQRISMNENEFIVKKYENVSYVIFKRKSKDPFIKKFHSLVEGITEALEKNYLKEVFIYFRENETEHILESYRFKFRYNTENAESHTKPEAVKQATTDFFAAINELGEEKLDPEKTEFVAELTYTDDVPWNYEPPQFNAAKNPSCLSLQGRAVNLCSINTGFHKITCCRREQLFNQSVSSSSNQPVEVMEMEKEMQPATKDVTSKKRRSESGLSGGTMQFKSVTGSLYVTDGTSNGDHISLTSSEGEYVSCPCNWDLADFETVKCPKCFGFVHLVCHGYMAIEDLDQDTFTCYYCSDNRNKDDTKLFMKFRVILYETHVTKLLPVTILQLATVEERKFILDRMESLKICETNDQGVTSIDVDNLSKAISTCFTSKDSQFFE